jgi:hypothetical protein
MEGLATAVENISAGNSTAPDTAPMTTAGTKLQSACN